MAKMAGNRDEADMERFGNFVAELRGEKGITQRQLAEQLFVSNKAVSKWECGLSMPDVALLLPLAEALGVTVEELLRGRRQEERTAEASGQTEQEFGGTVSGGGRPSREVRRKRAVAYAFELALAGGELALLYLCGGRFGISPWAVSLDTICVMLLPLLFGVWFFFCAKEKLPPQYDRERINFYADGFFQMSMGGICFNNRNWPHIIGAGRAYCLLTPVLWPAAYFLLRLVVPELAWHFLRLPVELAVVLGGLFIPMSVVGRKYE